MAKLKWKMHSKQYEVWASEARYKMIMAGRRGGKSELGIMWVGAIARDAALLGQEGVIWIVEPTTGELPTMWRKARRIYPDNWITDKSGSEKAPNFLKMNDIIIQFRSADRPERLVAEGLRAVWVDEAGIMLKNEEIWAEYIRPTLIDYSAPALITGTPKGKNIFYQLFIRGLDPEQKDYESFHWTSYANPFIPAEEITAIAGDMTSRIYQQEILAKVLEDNPDALWKRKWIDETRVIKHPQLTRIVVAIDPQASDNEQSAETGIIVAGLGTDNHGYVLEDATVKGSPKMWGNAAVTAYHKYEADLIVGEVNNGGDMVEHVIRTEDETVPYKSVRATRGKQIRAEPVSALYEQEKIHHVGTFPELEDQLCEWQPGDKSPDRLDALVWGFTELMLSRKKVKVIGAWGRRGD